MPKKKDWSYLIGKRFGMLTTVCELPKEKWIRGSVTILCKCDCGKEKAVRASLLERGEATSCGCLKHAHDILRDRADSKVIGKKYNMLIPIKRLPGNKSLFLCKCDCGNEAVIRISDVTDGTTKSCGCFQKEGSRKRILERNDLKHFERTNVSFLESVMKEEHEPAKNNKSGVTGVCLHKQKNGTYKWMAYISVNKTKKYLGDFDRKEDAIKVRKAAEEKYMAPVVERFYDSKGKD